jgi:hypothetical protein
MQHKVILDRSFAYLLVAYLERAEGKLRILLSIAADIQL